MNILRLSRIQIARPSLQCRLAIRHYANAAAAAAANVQQSGSNPFTQLDAKWREKWKEDPPRLARKHLIENPTRDQQHFVLSMIPYPSGVLHMGHLRVYTISDVLARYRRMAGYDTVHAMGWDSFGLPAENAAIERQIHPAEWTVSNMAKMKSQMDEMLAEFDWEREFSSCFPDYYKWTQKLFLMMYEHGKAYQALSPVNWDPVDQTVLANEQVDSEGRSWRSGAIVEKKMLRQWFLKITDYSDALLDDLKLLDQWPAKVKTMQEHWLGRSEGATVVFDSTSEGNFPVFTTRPDTLFGVQFVALALDHADVREAAKTDSELAAFLERAKDLPDDTKEGYLMKNLSAISPVTGEKLPVFAAPYVIGDYGSGCVMGCPGHDERDFEFWGKNGSGPVKTVIDPVEGEEVSVPLTSRGVLNKHCGKYAGSPSLEGGKSIVNELPDEQASLKTNYKLRDWLVSRQRFWGAPIPIVYCDSCGTVPVPDEQLPVLLPETVLQKGEKPATAASLALAHNEEFKKCNCPKCGGPARRETDTMDTFMDSSWYFFRYTDPQNKELPFSYQAASNLMPVDMYIGGIEHAILHLLYARFVAKFLADKGYWSGADLNGEPIKRLVTQGMVHGKTFKEPTTGRFLKPEEIDRSGPVAKVQGTDVECAVSWEKMSKSKYNGADPSTCIQQHGADAVRAHVLFQAAVNDVLDWDEGKIVGIKRWLLKVKSITESVVKLNPSSKGLDKSSFSDADRTLWNETQHYVKSASDSFHESLQLNTVISDYMKLTNTLQKESGASPEVQLYALETLLKIMSPVAPAMAEECWELICKSKGAEWSSVFRNAFPEAQAEIQSATVPFKVMINGKFQFTANKPHDFGSQSEAEILAQLRTISDKLGDKPVRKVIIPKKGNVISLVV
ncbi:YALIA101S02e21792g1_1 [Yarrowia lipolytica]|nr:Putative leucine--tRNA ligase [Yarrowia lipolytica]SEI32619.1 YALIA101S02e21792g1_1 [Yarrowia lipolytica]